MGLPRNAEQIARVVVGFGAVAVDELIFLAAPLSAGKGRILARERRYGGNVGTGLAAVASLGGSASFVGFLPDRALWGDVHADLVKLGVDIESATALENASPIRSTILVGPDGDRFIAFDDAVPVGAPTDLDLDLVENAGALLLDGYGPAAGIRAVEAARAHGVPVVGDFELTDGPETEALIATVDHLVLPLGFARGLAGAPDGPSAVEALWNEHRSAVVVTDGGNGSWHRSAEDTTVHHIPAFRVEVVDTTGCGDIFHGAYALAIAERQTVAHAVRFASAAAALGATGRGGRGHLPRRAEIRQLTEGGIAQTAARTSD